MISLFDLPDTRIVGFYRSRGPADCFILSDPDRLRNEIGTGTGTGTGTGKRRAMVASLGDLLSGSVESQAPGGRIFVCLDQGHRQAVVALRQRFGAERVLSYHHEVYPALLARGKLAVPESAPMQLRYIIWAPSRSGSSWLCDLLRANRMGNPREHLRPPFVAWARHRGDFSPARFFDTLMRHGQRGGIFGTKIVVGYLDAIRDKMGEARIERALAMLNRRGFQHILLFRRDTILQAVSAYIAARTNRWARRRLWHRGAPPPPYDEEAIRRAVQGQQRQDEMLRWLQQRLGPTKVVCYENLAADPAGEVRAIMRFLGAQPGWVDVAGGRRRERTAVNLAYADRFARAHGKIEAAAPDAPASG